MIRVLACMAMVAALLVGGSPAAVPAPSLLPQGQETALDRPGDGDDHTVCLCEVIGTCSAQMGPQAGASSDAPWPGRCTASVVDERPPSGIVPEIPSPPPRAR